MYVLTIIFRIALAILIAMLAGSYFAAVLPAPVAHTLAFVLAIAELIGPFFNAQGAGWRLLLRIGVVLLVWPGVALLLQGAGVEDRALRVSLAAAAASTCGVFAAGQGHGKDTSRLVAILIGVAVPVYSLILAITTESQWGTAGACLAIATATWMVRMALVLPPLQSRALKLASVGAAASAFIGSLYAIL